MTPIPSIRCRVLVTAMGLYTLVGGALSFLGWFLDLPRLTDWDNDGLSIQPNATVCATLTGLALLALVKVRGRLVIMLGVGVALIGTLTLFEWITGINVGIDTPLMFGHEWGRKGVVFPGRMGPPGSLSWTLIGLALVLTSARPAVRRFVPALGVITLAISSLSLIGYLYGVDTLYSLPHLTVIALQTATFALAASLAIIVSQPHFEPMHTLLDKGSAGVLMRRALPMALILPIMLGYLGIAGQRANLYDNNMGAASLVLALVGFFLGIIWWAAGAVRLNEQALARRETFVSGVLGSVTDGFLVVDRDWRCTFINAEIERRIGVPSKDVLGKRIWDLFPEAVGNEAYLQLHRAMQERISVEYEFFYQPWQSWLLDKAYPTDDGGLAVHSRDITSHRQAEEQVLRGAELLTFIIDRSPSGFYIVDADFRISHMNADSQARAFRNVNPAIGRSFDDAIRVIWPEPLATEICDIFRHTLETGTPYKSPGLISPRADVGSTETYEWELQRITMPDGRYAVVCYYYDTTELRAAERALREADRRKDEFLATLAHELRNPLAPIRNSLHMLRLTEAQTPAQAQVVDMMERQITHMVRLVDDLLEVSRITRGKIQLRKETIELASVIRSAVESTGHLMEAAAHQLAISLPPEPVLIDGDPVRLTQVLVNLLSNAVKYTEDGGQIWLTIRQDQDTAIISVRDTGSGIPAQMLPRVFDLFTQIDQTLGRAQGGLGIGLALVKSLVEMHDGTVEAHSDGPSTGSEFIVRLPVTRAKACSKLDGKPQIDLLRQVQTGSRILVVDDNQDSANSLALLLRALGMETRTAYDGPAALEAVLAHQPSIVFLDIGMPGMDGYEVAKRIQSERSCAHIKLIALTGWGQEDDRRRSLEAGFDHHMVKPFEIDTLQSVLASIHAQSSAARDL